MRPKPSQAMAVGAQDYLVKDLMDARLLDHSLRHSIERNRLVVQHARSAHQSEVDRSAAVTASETSDDRRHWLEACAELTQRLFAGDSDRPLDLVLRYALEGTRADLAALTLAVGDEVLRVEAAIGVGASELIGSIGDRQSSLAGKVVRLGLPVMVDDYRQEPEGAGSLLGSFAVVPLLAGDRAVGTLTVARLAGGPLFSKSDVAQLADYANYAGLALELDHARAEEARELEAEREESHRLDSLGQLAGGVAHDFNNLLGVILNYTALIALSVTDPSILADLGEVRAAAERGAALTRQLLTFARRDIANPEPVDVTEIIRSVASMLGRTLGEQVVLELDLSSSPMVVLADRHQLEQILVNLALNARDAMPDGGVLTILAQPVEPEGDEVLLQVRDTGTGMTPDVIARAFEPFFTTKARGHGTGLGLATVHGIVHQNNGEVTIKSVIGQGTAVSVVLPTTKRSAPLAAITTQSLGGNERILLVEDEAPLRVATARLLASKGYEVLVAGDGVEALEVLDRAETPDRCRRHRPRHAPHGRQRAGPVARRPRCHPSRHHAQRLRLGRSRVERTGAGQARLGGAAAGGATRSLRCLRPRWSRWPLKRQLPPVHRSVC